VLKFPLDPYPYPQDPRSQPIHAGLPDGLYAYVRDQNGLVWVLPDGPHVHPRVLGGGQPAQYAGDLSIRNGDITDLTNLSGTFCFDDIDGLLDAVDQCRKQGVNLQIGAVRYFAADGSAPRILR
jgi:hypothetical protein